VRVPDELDPVARYGLASGLAVRPRTILVEGTTDADLFQLAARLEGEASGLDLLGADLAIAAAGMGDAGGTQGVIRELVALRALARICLLPNGRPRYRFIGLFDNDKAGRQAVRAAHDLDRSIIEYKDVFRLWPVMPLSSNLDPGALQRAFEKENGGLKGLEWELEDMLPNEFYDSFLSECPGAVFRSATADGKVHRDLTPDGKARFHWFIRQHAIRRDLTGVVQVLGALRVYLGLK
jgi:hypothetical protein